LAHSGTIFLDEIGELPAETQIALLRVLQERQFERVGGYARHSTDVRIITATNRDLSAAIAAGAFRADLFYRLKRLPDPCAAASEPKGRHSDAGRVLREALCGEGPKADQQDRQDTFKLCQSYPWPGNIRELQNIIERSVILCTGIPFDR